MSGGLTQTNLGVQPAGQTSLSVTTSPGQLFKSANGGQNGVGSATLATVTAGKTARIFGFVISLITEGALAYPGTAQITANGVTLCTLLVGSTAAGNGSNAYSIPPTGPSWLIEAPATTNIVLTIGSGANTVANATVWYTEV